MRQLFLVVLVLAGSGSLAWLLLELAGTLSPPDEPLRGVSQRPEKSLWLAPRSGESFVADALPRHMGAGASSGLSDAPAPYNYEEDE